MITITFTNEDERTICAYIRTAHDGYSGPVFINIHRLEELHMPMSKIIVSEALNKASKGGMTA